MLEKGTIVAGYRIDGVLGEGGMGTVYRATQLSLKRSVALKILSSNLGDDAGFRERFRREGLKQAAIDHPHIVTVYDTGETEHGLFLAMRMVRGPTLKDMILGRELDTRRSLSILKQVAEALDTAHDVGLTHRDIKPQNILIGARDHAYLADFGLTLAPDESGMLTATGQFVGTIDYVSPEQINGAPATERSDIYALTGVVFECLVGSVPYPKPSEPQVMFAHVSEPPPRPTEHRPTLPAAIDDVVAKGMSKTPAERYASAGALLAAAARALGADLRTASRPPGPAAGPEAVGVRAAAGATRPVDTQSPEDVAGGVTAASPVQTAPQAPVVLRADRTVPASVVAPGRPRAVPVAAVAAALVVVAAVAGFALGGSGGTASEGAGLGNSASAGTLAISFPDGWKRVTQRPAVPGLDLSQPIVLAPPGFPSSRLEAGQTDAVGPTLLPSGFLARLDAPPARTDARKLGRLQAYRYAGLAPDGARGRVTVYVAPTTEGVTTVACAADADALAGLTPECERVAGTLELTVGKPLALGPRADYAKAATGVLNRLTAAVGPGTSRLVGAKTAAAQASAAKGLAVAHQRAARQFTATPAGPHERGANAQLVTALRQIGAGYERAASAARGGDRAAYAAAGRTVRSGGVALRRALADLAELGYAVKQR